MGHKDLVVFASVLGDPEVTTNIYCKSRNLPNKDTQNYSTDLQKLLGPSVFLYIFMIKIRLLTLKCIRIRSELKLILNNN